MKLSDQMYRLAQHSDAALEAEVLEVYDYWLQQIEAAAKKGARRVVLTVVTQGFSLLSSYASDGSSSRGRPHTPMLLASDGAKLQAMPLLVKLLERDGFIVKGTGYLGQVVAVWRRPRIVD